MIEINKIKRIAVCICGEPRTWKQTISSWKRIINDTEVQIDYFLQLWDTQTPIGVQTSGISYNEVKKIPEIPISESEINELIDSIKPIEYIIESKREFTPHNPNQPLFLTPQLSQWWAFMKVAKLKSDYEIKKEFIYDLVLRFRYDIYLHDYILLSNNKPRFGEIHGTHYYSFYDGNERLTRFGDLIWYSDSITFDILSNYYFEIPNIKSHKQGEYPEIIWHTFCAKNNLEIYQTGKHWPFELIRTNDRII